MTATDPEIRRAWAIQTVQLLRRALRYAKNAGAPRTTSRIRQAIDSAEGAVRMAEYRCTRALREQGK